MPDWLSRELRLPAGSTYSSLGQDVWKATPAVTERVLNVLVNLFRSRIGDVADHFVVDPELRQASISLAEAPFSTRSKNALRAAGLLARPADLAQLTFGQLLKISALGFRSALEIACVTEGLMSAKRAALQQLALFATEEQKPDWIERLVVFASKPWAAFISERDARFALYFPADSTGTVLERVERILEKPDSLSSAVYGPTLADALEPIQREVERLGSLGLREALNELLVASSKKRRHQVEALSLRFGWSGCVPRTLEDAAKPLGVTRERVRQIETRFLAQLPDHVFLPQLDRAIELLELSAPTAVSVASDVLLSGGVVTERFSVEAVIETARLLNRETDLRIEEVPGKGRILVGSSSSVRTIATAARKLAGMAGVASVYQVASTVGIERLSSNEARKVLRALSNIEFLNDDWFWVTDIPHGRNRLTNVANRILSVASPQTIHSLREGVRRAFTYRAKSHTKYEALVTPPSDVMTAFFRHSPDYVVKDREVSSANPLDYTQELGDIDRALVDVFRGTASGVLDRRTVVEACVKRGLNENSVSLSLTYSPVIEHLGIDIWKLRGVGVDPAAVEALREANANESLERRLLSFGWRPAGELWIAFRLPYSLASTVLGVPGTTKRYLAGRKFAGTDRATGTECGSISINDAGSAFGFSNFLRMSGAEPGDVLLAEFNLTQEKVYLSLTDEMVLEADVLAIE
jgi:hypothetical protein